MFKVLQLNNISPEGVKAFSSEKYHIGTSVDNPDAIILRSYDMHEMSIPKSLKCIGRAGSGVNNIPTEAMANHAIPVFNAPGANANAVKELVIASILIAARNINQAMNYVDGIENSKSLKLDIEKGKKQYVGYELPNKTIGIIGLGAIGVKVANTCLDLGMNVIGFDPMMTVENAWELKPGIEKAESIKDLLKSVDIITLHIPMTKSTENFIDIEEISHLDNECVIINLSREGIVNTEAVLKALDNNKLKNYVTDFPSKELINNPKVINMPHLGASTNEAEIKCSIMVAESIKSFLEDGNTVNSVNFPDVYLPNNGENRLCITNKNVPNIVGQFTTCLGKSGININDLSHKNLDQIGYTILVIDKPPENYIIDAISKIEGVIKINSIG
jgi:D-3-phosphoglycerate dehydrogenase